MTVCRTLLSALAAAWLAWPAAAGAGEPYAEEPVEAAPDGPGGFIGYPEFHGVKGRILRQIDQAAREDRITPRETQDFLDQFAEIREDEARDFRFYGWNPPVGVRDDIRYALNHLSQEIAGEAGY